MQSTHYSWQILIKLEFSQELKKKKHTQFSNFMKIHPVGAVLFQADTQTDRQTRPKRVFFAKFL